MGGDSRPDSGIVDALKSALTDVEDMIQKHERKPSVSLLMNAGRQVIFTFLCKHPCATLTGISRGTGLEITNVRWHLDKMVKAGILETAMDGKRAVYFPMHLIERKNVPLFSLLNDEKAKSILSAVTLKPGMSQKELCQSAEIKRANLSYLIEKLARAGLVSLMRDGRNVRYYPTDILYRLRLQNTKHTALFRRSLVTMLKRDGLSPRIVRSTYSEIHIEISRGTERIMLVVSTDPYTTALV